MASKSRTELESPLGAVQDEKPPVRGGASLSTDAVSVLRPFEEAYVSYMLELQEVWTNAQIQSEDAQRTYLRELEEIYSNVRRRYEDSHRARLNSLREKSGSEEGQEESQIEPEKLQTGWGPEEELACFEAYSRYIKALEDAWNADNARARFEKAYRTYLLALTRAWGQVNADNLSWYYLSIISQSINTAASWAARTLG